MKTNYVLIDFENILPDNLELLDQEWIRVLLFVGQNQRKLPFPIVRAMQKMGERAQYVEMAGVGHNALDFHIAYYIGRISESDKDAYFHIISNDSGFDPLIAHLKQLHIFADRVQRIDAIPIVVQSRVVDKTVEEKLEFVKKRLLKANAPRPRSRKTLASHISTMFLKALSPEDVAALVEGLFASGCVQKMGRRIVYSDESK